MVAREGSGGEGIVGATVIALFRVVTCGAVSRHDKILAQVLSGRSDANVRFDDLRSLLLGLGFVVRTRGSHHLFVKSGVEEQVNLQRDGANAKPYQVRQVRTIIVRYKLEELM
jgi:predicted RNA binding protein YcfA (HicA-like mRNA interferase family)